MGYIRGRIGGTLWGFIVDCEASASSIDGRLGGLGGADIHAVLQPETTTTTILAGRIGGMIVGDDLYLEVNDDSASGRLGGERMGSDIYVSGHDHISGRCGGDFVGFNIELNYEATTQTLSGRLGGGLFGKNVNFQLSDGIQPVLGAVVAAVTYVYYKKNQRWGSHSGSRRKVGQRIRVQRFTVSRRWTIGHPHDEP